MRGRTAVTGILTGILLGLQLELCAGPPQKPIPRSSTDRGALAGRPAETCNHPLFGNPEFYTGLEPISIVVGDFDGDADQDLAVCNFLSDDVSVLLNDGQAILQETSYPTGPYPRSVVTGDLDADGDLDLAVASHGPNNLSILLNTGSGGFDEQVAYSIEGTIVQVAAGDLDGNGLLDLVAANPSIEALVVLLNRGGTVFDPPVAYPSSRVEHVAVGDLNGDGSLDLFGGDDVEDSAVLFNQGDGTFGSPTLYGGLGAVALADLDGDGDLDVAGATGLLNVLLNVGDGSFGFPDTYATGGMESRPAIGDVDGDGDLDIASGSHHTDEVTVLLNHGDATFEESATFRAGAGQHCVVFSDLDGDSHLDLAASNFRVNSISLLLNDGSGRFQDDDPYATTDDVNHLESADMDGDGDSDLIITMDQQVSVILNQGAGVLSAGPQAPGEGLASLAVADMDGDHDPDVVAGDSEGHVSVFLNAGNGTLLIDGGYDVLYPPKTIAASTFDEDQYPDIAVGHHEGLSMLINQGDGGLAPPLLYGMETEIWDLEAADLNSDGHADLAAASSDGALVLLNNGTGLFDVATYGPSLNVELLDAGDVDGDRDLDLAVTDSFDDNLHVLFNAGDGTFPHVSTFLAARCPRDIALVDLTRDGKLDAVVSHDTTGAGGPDPLFNWYAGDVAVLVNLGNGVLSTPVFYGVGTQPGLIEAIDLDDDQALDLVVASRVDPELSLLFNRCQNSTSCGVVAQCADLDGDLIRDKTCEWWRCLDGRCAGTATVFGDMGGAHGTCSPDGVADGHDHFHAADCFADRNTDGLEPYPCEQDAPQAWNVDIAGPVDGCRPDGLCDGHDAFATIDVFSAVSTCDCAGGPAPASNSAPGKESGVIATLQSEFRELHPLDVVRVDIFLEAGAIDLRGYQLRLSSWGGTRGQLILSDVMIAQRPDHAFAARPYWTAFNIHSSQVLAGLHSGSARATARAYLATVILRASADAQGVFFVGLDIGPRQGTFLFPPPLGERIRLVSTNPAEIIIKSRNSRHERQHLRSAP